MTEVNPDAIECALCFVGVLGVVVLLVWLVLRNPKSKPPHTPPLLTGQPVPNTAVVEAPPQPAPGTTDGSMPSVELTFCELAGLMTWDGWYRYRGPDGIVYLRVTRMAAGGTEFAVERITGEVLANAAGAGEAAMVAVEVFAIVDGHQVTMDVATVDARLPLGAPPLVDSALDAYKPVGSRIGPAEQRALRLQLINAVPMK